VNEHTGTQVLKTLQCKNLPRHPELVGNEGLWQHAELLVERNEFNV